MALILDDLWAWDLWLTPERVDGLWHMFFLQAPKSLGDPELRHGNATVGHATSANLRDWTYLGTALEPGAPGSWDDRAIWTGSVVRDERGLWHMFYTGTNKSHEHGLVQRVGVATSNDLTNWVKNPHVVIEADRRWYERIEFSPDGQRIDDSDWYEEAWRDPWVFRNPDGTGWEMLVTARTNGGPSDERGVIGVARSSDLVTWQVCEPIDVSGSFGHLEVPQFLHLKDGGQVITFGTGKVTHSRRRVAAQLPIWSGMGALVRDGAASKWRVMDTPILGSPHYAARIVHDRGRYLATGWLNHEDADFPGIIGDPVDITDALATLSTATPDPTLAG